MAWKVSLCYIALPWPMKWSQVTLSRQDYLNVLLALKLFFFVELFFCFFLKKVKEDNMNGVIIRVTSEVF